MNIKTLKKEITTGIIISVIMLLFVQPIVTNLWNLMTNATSGFYAYYLDITYKNASLGQRNWVDFLMLYLSLAVLFIVTFSFFHKIRLDVEYGIFENKLKSALDENEKKIVIDNNKNTNSYKIGILLNQHLNKLRVSTYIIQIFTFLLFFHFIFITYVDLQLNASFKQRITVLAPYITDQEEEILQAKWALMKNRNDNNQINKELEDIAKQKKIRLPELLLK